VTIAAGTRLGPYEILAPLGAGGMGEVYRARDTRVGREVAVKILPRDFAADPQRRRRFEQEARLAASLNHPNIVGLFDVGPDLDPPYIVSELVPGVSLRAVMNRGAIPLRKVLDLAGQMVEGLAAAHLAGVVHRDIKPENVMVTPEGRVKILDFGLARVQEGRGPDSSGSQTVTVGPETPHPTSPGMVVGTVAYMSPEQASGHKVDYRSDQFSLGLVLYEMLARRRAFEGKSTAQTMAAIIEDEAPPLPATVPTQVRWVVERCLAKDPPKRYASTQDLAHELRQLGEHISDLTSSSSEALAAKQRRGSKFWIAAAFTMMLALLLLSLRALSRVDPPPCPNCKLANFSSVLKDSRNPSWSADGRSIAFLGNAEGESWAQLWVQGRDAATPVQLTRAPFRPYGNALSWAPDSRSIYCSGAVGSNWGIFRVPVAGGEPVLVQPDAQECSLSPDGKTLVMVARGAPRASEPWRLWYASPPTAPRRLYEPQLVFEGITAHHVEFSPNGAKVLVWNANLGARGECWLFPWPPGIGRRLHGLEDANMDGGIAWMPDSRHIVYSMGSLNMADTNTGKHWHHLMGSTGVSLANPSVSSDGTQIAYAAVAAHMDVIEIPLEGGLPRTLVGTRRMEAMPALSSDGKELVYATTARGASEVWSMNMEDRAIRRMTSPAIFEGAAVNPAISRDRKRIAFQGYKDGKIGIYIALSAGGAPVRATVQESAGEILPTWSPDGNRLAYVLWTDSSSYLEVVRPGGMESPTKIWEGETWIAPEWSPTGDWIAVADTSHIVLVSPDGRAKRDLQIASGPLAWAPDGRTLYVIHDESGRGRVDAIDIRTGRSRAVRDLADLLPDSYLLPGQRVSVTPNGKALVYAVARGGGDIVLAEGVQIPKPWYARLWSW